jgi:WD40 repeat protein
MQIAALHEPADRFVVAPDAARVVGAQGHNVVWEWEVGRLVRKFPTGLELIFCLALPAQRNPQGVVLLGGVDLVVELWSLADGRRLAEFDFEARGERVAAVALSEPAADVAAAASDDGFARLWTASTAEPRYTLHQLDICGYHMRLSPDGQRMALLHSNPYLELNVWDTRTGAVATNPRYHALVGDDCAADLSASGVALIPLWDAPARAVRQPLQLQLADRIGKHLCPSSIAAAPLWVAVWSGGPHHHPGSIYVFSRGSGALIGEVPFPHTCHMTFLLTDPKVLVVQNDDDELEALRLWAVEEAALATLGHPKWRAFWRRDGDGALWARVWSFAGP